MNLSRPALFHARPLHPGAIIMRKRTVASVAEKERKILEIIKEMRELVLEENGNGTR